MRCRVGFPPVPMCLLPPTMAYTTSSRPAPMSVKRCSANAIAAITHADPATLVYTSGTTGRPKGCLLSHGNLIWEVRQVVSKMEHLFTADGSTLMFLPLAHILARVVQVGCVTRGVKIGYSTGIANLVTELGLLQPSWVFAVPRVFEKVFNTAQGKAGSGLQRKIFDRAVEVAVAYSEQSIAGDVSLRTKAEHAV